jgi:hypothetical protein
VSPLEDTIPIVVIPHNVKDHEVNDLCSRIHSHNMPKKVNLMLVSSHHQGVPAFLLSCGTTSLPMSFDMN